ncbi:MAG: transposase [Gammaproteobacteria bacterium]|nr:transposase [Gammaproteobacteria bacterium]
MNEAPACDLDRKLREFRHYYNHHRVHSSLNRTTPAETRHKSIIHRADLSNYGWMPLCRRLYQLPTAT